MHLLTAQFVKRQIPKLSSSDQSLGFLSQRNGVRYQLYNFRIEVEQVLHQSLGFLGKMSWLGLEIKPQNKLMELKSREFYSKLKYKFGRNCKLENDKNENLRAYLDKLVKIRFEQADLTFAVIFGLRHGFLDEVTGADVDEDLVGVLEGAGDIKRRRKRDEHLLALRAQGEVVEGGGGDLEASGGCTDVVEGVLKKIDFHISLFFDCLQLLWAQLLHLRSHVHAHRLLHLSLCILFQHCLSLESTRLPASPFDIKRIPFFF